jgi:L-glutamine-phosphate cytidylyltransferase
MTTEAVILAAGRGSRMETLTKNQPKSFVKFKEKRLIDYQISKLKSSGISKIYIVTGYMADRFIEFESDTVELVYNKNWATTNMIWSLLCVADKLKNKTIILYSDIIYDDNILNNIIKIKYDNCIIADLDWKKQWNYRFSDVLDDAESLQFNKNRILTNIGDKVDDANEIMAQFCGIIKINLNFINLLKLQGKINLRAIDFTTSINQLISEGFEMHVDLIKGGWFEIDTQSDLEVLETYHSQFIHT